MKKHESCVLCFVKYPKKGYVKRRLAADLNEDLVVELYRNFVLDTVATLQKLDTQILICFSPVTAQKKIHKWLGSSYRYVPQQGDDLGERMKNSFCSVFTEGFRRAVLIGSDSPDISAGFLSSAFKELLTHDMVLGPSSDGGYYLIGFRNDMFLPSVFDEITWGTSTVFQKTIMKAKKAHLALSVLPVWSDVDTIADLKNLIKRNQDTAFKSSHTITYMTQNKILTENNDVEISER